MVSLELTAEQQAAAEKNGQYSSRLSYFEQFRRKNVDLCCFGDSITQGLDWQDAYPSLKVSNRGIGSDTTLGMLARLDDVEAQAPRVISLLAGINDIAAGRSTQEIIDTYGTLLEELTHRLPDTVIIVTSVLPVTAEHSVDNADVQALNAALRPLCEEKGATWVDVYGDFLDDTGNMDVTLAADSIHPNVAGYLVWLRALDKALHSATQNS